MIYKYCPSLMAVYDALFLRGQAEHLAVMRTAMAEADPGLPALIHGLEAGGRWALANRALAQLLFWCPVPSFEPSAAAFAVSDDYTPEGSRFTGTIEWVQLDIDENAEDLDHLISTEERLKIAMTRH